MGCACGASFVCKAARDYARTGGINQSTIGTVKALHRLHRQSSGVGVVIIGWLHLDKA